MGRNSKTRTDWEIEGGAFRIENAYQNGNVRDDILRVRIGRLYLLAGSSYGFCR